MKRNWRDIQITRKWVATVTFKGDPAGYRKLTTCIHGSNPSDAEQTYLREHPDVASIVIHSEQR